FRIVHPLLDGLYHVQLAGIQGAGSLATLVWIKHFGNSETLSSDLPIKANFGQAFVAECLKALWADQSISDRSINRMIEVARNSIKSLIDEDEKAFKAFR
ncbi:hypothetical protein AAFF88_15280, partial [Hyphobacterium sp. WM6]|uniref:hypothetical protein n=1 Tax=Hyphobacterium sp. WM6 TaxID=3140243 RepID=UPI0031B738C0